MTRTKKISLIAGFLAVFTLSGVGCKDDARSQYALELEMWGVFDASDAYNEIFAEYKQVNPFVKGIRYRKFASYDEYKRELIDALASGQGPDIFMIHNTWLPQFQNKTVPATQATLNEQTFLKNFPDVAHFDFVRDGNVYGVPLSIDSLGLYYNKDLFNAVGITQPPKTWTEFNAAVEKLTEVDDVGNIKRSGAAIGTAQNVNRSMDILSLLMIQSGAEMTDRDFSQATFHRPVSSLGRTVNPGEKALDYYTQFARVSLPQTYTWNERQHYSIDAFFENTAAMMINYSWHYNTIKAKNEKLNFAVAPVPQLSAAPDQQASYANYWGYAVAKNKEIKNDPRNPVQITDEIRTHAAWEFLRYMTINDGGKTQVSNLITGNSRIFDLTIDPAQTYLDVTGKPAARKDLIEKQKTDVVLGPFASGNLIARSWYQVEPEQNDTILAEAIESVNKGAASVSEALTLAANRISQLMR